MNFFLHLYAVTLLLSSDTNEFKTATGRQNFWPAPSWAYHVAASFFLLGFTVPLNGPSYPVEFSRTLEQLMGFRDFVKTNKMWLAYKKILKTFYIFDLESSHFKKKFHV